MGLRHFDIKCIFQLFQCQLPTTPTQQCGHHLHLWMREHGLRELQERARGHVSGNLRLRTDHVQPSASLPSAQHVSLKMMLSGNKVSWWRGSHVPMLSVRSHECIQKTRAQDLIDPLGWKEVFQVAEAVAL